MEELLAVSKCICLAFPSEEHYEQCMKDALYLCKWGIPFGALTYVSGHNDMFWYRAYISTEFTAC